ncbi:MAG: hypothetical protein AAGN35_17965 [Bacteroidota bacterium]
MPTFRLLLFLLLTAPSAFAQSLSHTNYTWAENPSIHALNEKETQAHAVILKDARIVEFRIEDEMPTRYRTLHRLVHLNDQTGIEMHNRVYIPVPSDGELVQLSARAIAPGGEVTLFNRDRLKRIENQDEYGDMQIFALEGAVVGGEVEYLLTVKSMARPDGQETVSAFSPTREAIFSLDADPYFTVSAKSYFCGDLNLEKGHSAYLRLENIEVRKEELFSLDDGNRPKIFYRVDEVNYEDGSKATISSWLKVQKFLASVFLMEESEATQVALRDFLKKEVRIRKSMSEEEKILALEEYFKMRFQIQEAESDETRDLQWVLEAKIASEFALTRLFNLAFREWGVDRRLLATCNRYEHRFDKDFFSSANVQNFLFYFPQTDRYLAPYAYQYRYGLPPNYYADQYAFEILDKERTSLYAGVLPKFHFVAIGGHEANFMHKDYDIRFAEDYRKVTVNLSIDWGGNHASGIRADYNLLQESERKEYLEDMFFTFNDDGIVSNAAIAHPENTELELPVTTSAEVQIPSMLERAGEDILFKVGEILGEQWELYREELRQQPVDMPYPESYRHRIRFAIPPGYRMEGEESARIEHKMELDGGQVAGFHSEVTVNGRQVEIVIREFYALGSYPMDRYEDFRRVINSAADFNKAVIVFTPEK